MSGGNKLKTMVQKLHGLLGTVSDELTAGIPKMQEHLNNVNNLITGVHEVRSNAQALITSPNAGNPARGSGLKNVPWHVQVSNIKTGGTLSSDTTEEIFNQIYLNSIGKDVLSKTVDMYKKIVSAFHKSGRLKYLKVESINNSTVGGVATKVKEVVKSMTTKLSGGTYNIDDLTRNLVNELSNQFGLTFTDPKL